MRRRTRRQYPLYFLLAIPLACLILGLLGVGLYNLPPIHDRLSWRVDGWVTQIKYALNPPSQVEFVPQEQVSVIVQATLDALTPSPHPHPDPHPDANPARADRHPGADGDPHPDLHPGACCGAPERGKV